MAKKKSGGFKAPKHYEPKRGAQGKKGSRSPSHRGYRPEETERPKKARWSGDDRAARDQFASRPKRGDRDERYGRQDRDFRQDRGDRYARDDRRQDRGYRGGRDDRQGRDWNERLSRGRNDRSERFDRGGRDDRFDRADRSDRFSRGDRRRDDFDRGGRFDRDDRGYRGDRSRRDDRFQRPAGRDERGEGSGARMRSFDERGAERAGRRERHGDYFRDRAREEREPRRDSRERGDRFERRERFDRAERTERFDRGRRGDRDGRFERAERGSYPGGDDRMGRAERFVPEEDVVLERLSAIQTAPEDVSGITFASLGLGDNIVRVLGELGAETPFPIQAATIPDVLVGKNVLGRGRTGSGKTIAFGAPLVERLLQMKADGLFDSDPPRNQRPERPKCGERAQRRPRTPGRKPKALIMAPTRELALQIDRTVQPIARSVGLFTTQIYGGVPQARQVDALNRGVDIVIGTPGRIEDLIAQGRLDLSEIRISVLDEADHMCDLGFLEPVQRILRQTAPGGQKLLFSATLDKGVADLVGEFLTEHVVHEVAGEDQASGTIDHQVFVVLREHKLQVLTELTDRPGKILVFTRTRAYAEQVTEMLEDEGIPAVALHGDLNQAKRTRNLQRLTSGRVNVLVATDVAARGIHVDDIDLVIQADAPDEYKTYLHRAGRTGRAGKPGTVVTLVPRNRQRRTRELLQRAEIKPSTFGDFFPGDELVIDEAADSVVESALV